MNLALIVLVIAICAILHLVVGLLGIARLAKAFRGSNNWKASLKIGVETSAFFGLATLLWVGLLFLLPRTQAPIPVLNYPAWILLVLSFIIYALVGQSKSETALSLTAGVAAAVPGSAIFAYANNQLLESIFGAIRIY